MRQARRKFYGDTPAGIELGGYPGELVNVTPQSLKAEYDRILSTAYIDVMVQGVDEARVADMLLKKLDGIRRDPRPFAAPIAMPATPLRHFKEEIPGLTQAKLCMLFTTGEANPNPPSVSILRVAMSVLGGSATSRLFRNVREKQSLCYYCGSAAQRATGVMMIDSGVEPGKEQQAEAARQADADTDQLEQKRQAQLAHQRELVEESERLHERHTQDGDQLHRTEILYDRADNEQKTLSEHMWNTYEATLATAEEFRLPPGEFVLTSGERDANGLRREIRELGPINAHAVEEYAQTKERFDDLSRQKEDMTKAESDLRGLIKRLLSQMEKQFVTEFDRLNGYFQQTFVRLFGGGQAELKLTDPNDPLCCGIEVVAQPPGKKLQLLSLLSGGERALTAIAILFAMLKVKPSPFCILDEIEAALDDANISYFADYLVEFAKTTQFVVVTHRKGTMERCDSLYGVAMEEKGVSSMVSVNLENYH